MLSLPYPFKCSLTRKLGQLDEMVLHQNKFGAYGTEDKEQAGPWWQESVPRTQCSSSPDPGLKLKPGFSFVTNSL